MPLANLRRLKLSPARARTLVVVLVLQLPLIVGADPVVVHVSPDPQQRMTYGMDFERLWHLRDDGVEVDLNELADYGVGKCRVDYVRVAINPAAELEEGKVNWGCYDSQIRLMRAIAKVRPDIKWFASPRPLPNELKGAPYTPFPLWVNVFHPNAKGKNKFDHLEGQKGADYYARYLRFMKDKGFTITYLDATNEATAHLRPQALAEMIELLRKDMGDQMPQVVAPSAFSRADGVTWIREAVEQHCADFWQVTAVHNTKDSGTLEEFVNLARTLDRPIWNTELHGFDGPDDLAVANTKVLFDHVRAGFNGIDCWLALGNEKKAHKMLRNIKGKLEVMRTYYIFAALVNGSDGANRLNCDVPSPLTSAVAFRDDGRGSVTVWVLNGSDQGVDLRIDLGGLAAAPSAARWWSPANGREGTSEELRAPEHAVAAHSLYCFTFRQSSPAAPSKSQN
jgi:hypothetical protein